MSKAVYFETSGEHFHSEIRISVREHEWKKAMLMLYSDKQSNKHKEQSDGCREYIVRKAVECQYCDIFKHEEARVNKRHASMCPVCGR